MADTVRVEFTPYYIMTCGFIHLFFENHWTVLRYHFKNNIMDRLEAGRIMPHYQTINILLFTGRVMYLSGRFPGTARKAVKSQSPIGEITRF